MLASQPKVVPELEKQDLRDKVVRALDQFSVDSMYNSITSIVGGSKEWSMG